MPSHKPRNETNSGSRDRNTFADDADDYGIADDVDAIDDVPPPHHSMSENIDFFFDLEREGLFSFVFIANEKGAPAPTYRFAGPDKIVGTALVAAALHGFPFCRPVGMEFFGDTREERCITEDVRNSQTKQVAQVHNRVREMIRDDDDFVLVWHIAGDRSVHWQAGGALAKTGRSQLRAFLVTYLSDVLREPTYGGLVGC